MVGFSVEKSKHFARFSSTMFLKIKLDEYAV